MMFVSQLLVVLFNAVIFHGLTSGQKYREECRVWDDLIERLKKEDNLEVDCLRNKQCTGIDCKGSYVYSGAYTLYQPYRLDVCFGILIHPCHEPKPNLTFYLEQLETNTTFQKDVDHSDIYQIPGSHYDLGSLVTADGFIQVDMNDTTLHGQRAMEIGMYFKMRVTMFGQESYPDDFRVTLIPDTYIPVPRCNSAVVTPKHVPYTCGYDGKSGPPKVPPTRPTSAPAPQPGAICKESNSFGEVKKACGNHQQCRDGHCVCTVNYIYNVTSKLCVGTTRDTRDDDPPAIDFGQPSDDSSSLSKKMMIIIVTCSIGGLLILVAVVAVVIVKYMRYKKRYGQRELLLNNEDDPVEVAT